MVIASVRAEHGQHGEQQQPDEILRADDRARTAAAGSHAVILSPASVTQWTVQHVFMENLTSPATPGAPAPTQSKTAASPEDDIHSPTFFRSSNNSTTPAGRGQATRRHGGVGHAPTRSSSISDARWMAYCRSDRFAIQRRADREGRRSAAGHHHRHATQKATTLSTIRVERPKDWSGLERAFAEKTRHRRHGDRSGQGRPARGCRRAGASCRLRAAAREDQAEMEKLVGQEIQCRIIKLDTAERRRGGRPPRGARRGRSAAPSRSFAELKEGAVVRGTVRSAHRFRRVRRSGRRRRPAARLRHGWRAA